MSEPTQEQRDEAHEIALAAAKQWIASPLGDGPIFDAGRIAAFIERHISALIQQRDALKAELEASRRNHIDANQRNIKGWAEVDRLKAELAEAQENVAFLNLQRKEAEAELAVVKRDHGQAILRGQAEREAKEAAEARVGQLQEALKRSGHDLQQAIDVSMNYGEILDERDVLRARVGQLQEELTRAYKNGDAMVLEARERLAQVERERDQYRVLANMAECEMQQARARVSKLEAQLRADEQLDAERLTRISKLEGALRGMLSKEGPHVGCDCEKEARALLAPANRECLVCRKIAADLPTSGYHDPGCEAANRESKE